MRYHLSLLALSGLAFNLASASADPAKARVTAAPKVPSLFRRQSPDTCPDGDYTMCPDGFGCCERGAPCTTIRGEPACDSECSGLPCGDSGLCCDGVCTQSSGSAICLVGGGGGGLDVPTLTVDGDNTSETGSSTSTFDFDEEEETMTTTTVESETTTTTESETETDTESSSSTRSTATSTVTENDVIPGETDTSNSNDGEDTTSSTAPTQTIFSGGDDGTADTGSNPDEPGAASGLSVSYALTGMVVGLVGAAAILL
ncbi:hypothetical protein BDW74DRAFT_158332 [Aspergillus multicolor]|uniref:uncharacterized protein n=1 Tax=Aspergillus multicolor TaxID=41759 RepID=UPI003CCCA1F8